MFTKCYNQAVPLKNWLHVETKAQTEMNENSLACLSSFLNVHTSGSRRRAFTWDTFKTQTLEF